MISEKFKTLPQYLVPQHGLSRLFGVLSESQLPWLKNWMINTFIKVYSVDLSQAVITEPEDYPSFNSFFTRALKSEARPIVKAESQIASPVDGCVSQVGAIQDGRIFQAKGFDFSLVELLGGNAKQAEPFLQGQFATLYLAPKDYHRVHMPIAGELRETIYIPGRLFSVNQTTTRTVPRLFARNERLVCYFETHCGPMIIVLVGAMIVGSIQTVWEGVITRSKQSRVQRFPSSGKESVFLEKGAEVGLFKLGSTVVVLFPKNTVNWAAPLREGVEIQMGQLLATLRLPDQTYSEA